MKTQALVNQVINTLQHWLDIHTVGEKWAEYLLEGYSSAYDILYGPLNCGQGGEHDVLDLLIKENISSQCWYSCNECGSLLFDEVYCDDCEADNSSRAKENEALEYLREVYYHKGQWEKEVANALPINEYDIIALLETTVFDNYRAVVSSNTHVDTVIDEVREHLADIENAESKAELLCAVVWATHQDHVNGTIMCDYGNMRRSELDTLQQDGVMALCTDVEEWLVVKE